MKKISKNHYQYLKKKSIKKSRHLNLDLIVRNENGSVINPFETDIIEYFEYHWTKAQKLRSIFRCSNDSTNSTRLIPEKYSNNIESNRQSDHHYNYNYNHNHDEQFNINNYNNCFNFCITLSNFICMIKQDMIINMAIYDANNHKFLTENYIVKWEKTGFVREVEKINNIRVVFTVCLDRLID